MAKPARSVLLVLAFALSLGLVAQASPARADLLDSLLGQTSGGSGQTSTAKVKPASSSSASSTASTTTTGTTTGVTGPAIVPAVTPLVLDSYSTDPTLLMAGSQLTLNLVVKNPGGDQADDVVVSIGPSSSGRGWGSGDELVVLGSGSAQYIGSISPGQTNAKASFTILANPTSPGGVRSIPITMTWKSQTYAHSTSENVGLLVSTKVSLNSSLRVYGSQTAKTPFGVSAVIKNAGTHTVNMVQLKFSGSGASPSKTETITIGDLPAGATRTIPVKYLAPLAGRAKLTADVTYLDDFGQTRVVSLSGWAHVQRPAPPSQNSSPSIVDRVVAFAEALLGLNG